jgi:hypothetical protein
MRLDYIIQTIFAAICIAVVAPLLSGCKVQDCIPETIVRDSIRTEYKLDSIYLYEKDSIFIKEKADTVFVEKWKTRYKDVMKIERDTIYQENKVVEVKVERYVPQYIKWFAGIGAFFVVFYLVKFGLWVYRKLVLKV